MNDFTLKAKSTLEKTNSTLVLYKNGEMYTDSERGVKTLLNFVNNGNKFNGFSVADKVVGKAAAYLYVLLGIEELYAEVISEAALGVLGKHGIGIFYGEKADRIRNRTNTGFCPMETAVLSIETPEEALTAIREKWNELNQKGGTK